MNTSKNNNEPIEQEIKVTIKSKFRLTPPDNFALSDTELIISQPSADFMMNRKHPPHVRAAFAQLVTTVLAGGINAAIRSSVDCVPKGQHLGSVVTHITMMLGEQDGELIETYDVETED